MLEDFLKGMKKRSEKSMIQGAVAKTILSKKEKSHTNTLKAVKAEVSTTKERMINVSESVGDSVKGQFGKKAKKAMKIQTEKLNELQ